MTLALAQGHPAAPFNADFYSVAATVIPVLFLALTFQGSAFRQLRALFGPGTPYIAGLVLAAGLWGELYAILALYDKIASRGNAELVFIATFILVVAVSLAAFSGSLVPGSSREAPAALQGGTLPSESADGPSAAEPGTTPGKPPRGRRGKADAGPGR